MSIDPNYWGPGTWKLFYSIAYTYPDKPNLSEKTAALNFFSSLKLLIPCENCKEEYIKFLSDNPPQVNSKILLNQWILDLHNSINIRLKKPIVNSNDIQLILEQFDSNKNNTTAQQQQQQQQQKKIVPIRNLNSTGIKILPNPSKKHTSTVSLNLSKNKTEKPIIVPKKPSTVIRNPIKVKGVPLIKPACNCRKKLSNPTNI